MTGLTPPQKPIENWESLREDWVATVESLVANIESCCRENRWPTRRIIKVLEDPNIGGYRVPALLVQADLVQMMLDPRAGSVSDGQGVADFYVMPQYDDLATLIHNGSEWTCYYRYPDRGDKFADGVVFTRAEFVRIVKEMLGHVSA